MKVKIILFALCCFGVACSPKITLDYDKAVDFSQIRTYNFYPNQNMEGVGELDAKRILAAIKTQMSLKGYTQSETPDVYLDVLPSTQERKKHAGNMGVDIGNWGRNVGFNIGTSIPISRKVQDNQLVLSIVSATTNQLIWEGVFEDTTGRAKSVAEKEALISEVVSQLLSNFPPQ